MKRSRKSIEQRSKTNTAAQTEGQCPTVPTHKKPWLDSTGVPLADAALKTVSKGWSAQTWERYLQTLEVGVKESQPSLEEIGPRGICRNIFSLLSKGASDAETARLNDLLKVLTEKQIFIIKKIFWDLRC